MFVKLHRKSLAACLALLLAGVGGTALAADVRPSIDMGETGGQGLAMQFHEHCASS